MSQTDETTRQRAPSKRSLETRARIFDAAELLFAHQGFEGASIRDIAAAAHVQNALVSFHGGTKERLFAKVVARRADELSGLRLSALASLPAHPAPPLYDILDCFIRPLMVRACTHGPQWQAYARLIAQVSADPRWRDIARDCFDPAAKRFIAAIAAQYPAANPQSVATGFVFTVSSMLSLCTSQWRVATLGDMPTLDQNTLINDLVTFCEAGLHRVLAPPKT